ncbi:hypothetical protein QZH41_016327, partial [Actinostola sp. cb2023]
CNNTTEGPYNCKCPCSRNRIKKCYFDTSKKIETLCICKEGHQGIHCDKCTKHINKETIVIATCSVIGAVCIIAIVYLVYQKHRTRCIKRRIPKFWTVQISNRNYDDMDFSLLDPVTDTPFVYRNDTRDFEEALIADNSPKAQLRIDVDTFTEEFEDTSF